MEMIKILIDAISYAHNGYSNCLICPTTEVFVDEPGRPFAHVKREPTTEELEGVAKALVVLGLTEEQIERLVPGLRTRKMQCTDTEELVAKVKLELVKCRLNELGLRKAKLDTLQLITADNKSLCLSVESLLEILQE